MTTPLSPDEVDARQEFDLIKFINDSIESDWEDGVCYVQKSEVRKLVRTHITGPKNIDSCIANAIQQFREAGWSITNHKERKTDTASHFWEFKR